MAPSEDAAPLSSADLDRALSDAMSGEAAARWRAAKALRDAPRAPTPAARRAGLDCLNRLAADPDLAVALRAISSIGSCVSSFDADEADRSGAAVAQVVERARRAETRSEPIVGRGARVLAKLLAARPESAEAARQAALLFETLDRFSGIGVGTRVIVMRTLARLPLQLRAPVLDAAARRAPSAGAGPDSSTLWTLRDISWQIPADLFRVVIGKALADAASADPSVRERACFHLFYVMGFGALPHDPQIDAAIVQLLKDEDPAVQASAVLPGYQRLSKAVGEEASAWLEALRPVLLAPTPAQGGPRGNPFVVDVCYWIGQPSRGPAIWHVGFDLAAQPAAIRAQIAAIALEGTHSPDQWVQLGAVRALGSLSSGADLRLAEQIADRLEVLAAEDGPHMSWTAGAAHQSRFACAWQREGVDGPEAKLLAARYERDLASPSPTKRSAAKVALDRYARARREAAREQRRARHKAQPRPAGDSH